MSEAEQKSWLEDLQERRFFRFVISYLIAGWGLVQFLDWIVKRYAFSPSLVDLVIFLLLAFLPSVVLFTYYHGRPGKDQWSLAEKIFLPSNIIIAIALSAFLFSGKSLGATAEKVTLKDESGQTIERLVPKREFMSRISIFPLELDASIGEEDWLRLAIPQFLNYDLEQDNYLYAPSIYYLKRKYEIRNADLSEEIPFSLKRKIAEDSYSDQFTTGKLRKEGDDYVLDITVFTAKDGKPLSEGSYRSNNLMDLIDKTTEGILKNLTLAEVKAERRDVLDLPAASIYSANPEALKAYSTGYVLAIMNNDLDEGISQLKKAVELDPDFTLAYRFLAQAYTRKNLTQDAKSAIESAMAGIEQLPERLQFDVRFRYYAINEEIDKTLAILEMWRQLYPSNYVPYASEMRLRTERSEFEQAKAVGELALKEGHGGEILLMLASICRVQGHSDQAISYLESFTERYPERADETSELGNIYLQQGAFDKAEAHFEKLALLKPNDYKIIGRLGELEVSRANYEKAAQQYQKALNKATSASDSSDVYLWTYYYYAQTGQIVKAIESIEKRWDVLQSIRSPFEIGIEKLTYNFILTYLEGAQHDEYIVLRDKFYASIPDQTGIFKCVGELNYYIAVRDSVNLNLQMENCKARLAGMMGEDAMKMLNGYQEDINGNYDQAIDLFLAFLESMNIANDGVTIGVLGNIYLRAERYEEGIQLFKDGLENKPNYGLYHLFLAQAYQAVGKKAAAQKSVDQAIELWRLADDNYKYLLEAKALQAALS